MTIHPTVQTLTDEKRQRIHRHQLRCRIVALQKILWKGELDETHKEIVQDKISFLTTQLYPTVKK